MRRTTGCARHESFRPLRHGSSGLTLVRCVCPARSSSPSPCSFGHLERRQLPRRWSSSWSAKNRFESVWPRVAPGRVIRRRTRSSSNSSSSRASESRCARRRSAFATNRPSPLSRRPGGHQRKSLVGLSFAHRARRSRVASTLPPRSRYAFGHANRSITAWDPFPTRHQARHRDGRRPSRLRPQSAFRETWSACIRRCHSSTARRTRARP
jgi:hypothetical protein